MAEADRRLNYYPVIFLTHGAGPMMFLDAPALPIMGEVGRNSPAAQWFRNLSKQLALSRPPKAVLVITAHWETTDVIHISAQTKHNELFYDYYGFPPEAYTLEYKPPGDLNLSNRVKSLLEKSGFKAKLDDKRNFDHGVFIPMKLIYPQADIPIVSMSILNNLSADQHLAIGKALEPLRGEDILIIGSGASVHGFRVTDNQSEAFMQKLIETLTEISADQREHILLNWDQLLPFARANHPREEHFIPLHVIVGAAGSDSGQLINPNVSKTQAAFKFGV